MKRVLATILICTIVILSFAGCVRYPEVEEKMQGTWVCSTAKYRTVFTFKNGEYELTHYASSSTETTESGSYRIRSDGIYLGLSGDAPDITYSFDEVSGEFTMWDFNGTKLVRLNSYDI